MIEACYIYTLTDPRTNFVRYVGKTNDLRQRLCDHVCFKKSPEITPKWSWIASLKKQNLKPIIEMVEELHEPTTEEWCEAEKFWIQYLKFLGFDLLNSNEGGVGSARPSKQVRDKISNFSKKRVHSPETRARIAASCKARMTPEEKERLRIKCTGFRHDEATKQRIADSKKGKARPAHVRAALLAGSLRWKKENGFKLK